MNPGSIIREKRGFPDDWEDSITYYNKMPVDYTITAETLFNGELASIDAPLTGTLAFSKRYNSRTGFGKLVECKDWRKLRLASLALCSSPTIMAMVVGKGYCHRAS
ncbi:MAG: hypothetical protein R3F28_13075 [Candidatus Kapaibacterium sp.]